MGGGEREASCGIEMGRERLTTLSEREGGKERGEVRRIEREPMPAGGERAAGCQ